MRDAPNNLSRDVYHVMYVTPYYVTPYYVTPYYVTPYYVRPYYVRPYYVRHNAPHVISKVRSVIHAMLYKVTKATVTPAFTTPYDDLRWVNFGNRGPSGRIVCNRATLHDVAAIRGHRAMS